MTSRSGGLAGRFTRYGVVGLATNAAAYAVFLLFLALGCPPVWATGIVYVAATVTSYIMNSRWSFKSQASHGHDVPRYLLSYGIGFVVSIASMALLTRLMHPAIAQILVIGITAVVIFSSLELMKFGRQKE